MHERKDYDNAPLLEESMLPDPIAQFGLWYADAVAAGGSEPNAMTLATVDENGWPDARTVLLKAADPRGFSFYTNYESAKGKQLDGRPRAALVFHWGALDRQVRVVGRVERVSRAESEEYFATRPYGSQIGAWASKQSAPLDSRATLEARIREMESRYAEGSVPPPPHWGGYRVIPDEVEFWQGQLSRLHDRIRYRTTAAGWIRERLYP
ncbi:MAG: pyridoxamine 5'-phosphate oxidase [Bryobacteraceae bacterium]